MDKEGNKTGGRKKGVLNKSTQDIKALASEYGPEAVAELARLVTGAANEHTRVAACKELLDRGYGRASQVVESKTEQKVEIKYSDAELARRVAFMLQKAAEAKRKTEKETHAKIGTDPAIGIKS